MPQANVTLNLLRSSRRQPRLSAYTCLNGIYAFNKSPLALPGTPVIVHVTPNQRTNMAPHGVDGWYAGPSTEHYHCHKYYILSTFGIIDASQSTGSHTTFLFQVTADDYLRQTAASTC
jgi:hypothetical protein